MVENIVYNRISISRVGKAPTILKLRRDRKQIVPSKMLMGAIVDYTIQNSRDFKVFTTIGNTVLSQEICLTLSNTV